MYTYVYRSGHLGVFDLVTTASHALVNVDSIEYFITIDGQL